jgi:hypothetical protein
MLLAVASLGVIAGCGADDSDRTNKEGYAVGQGSRPSGTGSETGTDGTETSTSTSTDDGVPEDCIDADNYTGANSLEWGIREPAPATCAEGDGGIVNSIGGRGICGGGVMAVTLSESTTSKEAKVEGVYAIYASYKIGDKPGFFILTLAVAFGDTRFPAGTPWFDGACGSHDRSFDGGFSYGDGRSFQSGEQSLCPAGEVFFTDPERFDRIKVTIGGEKICGDLQDMR